MASMMKFHKMAAMAVIAHQERTCMTHSNDKIDPERTKDNYAVWPYNEPDQVGEKHGWQRLTHRLSQVKHLNRKDVNVLVEWVIHLGPDVPPGVENEKEFFQACMRYCEREYGAENICYGIVHMDETNPHLTVGFVPVVKKPLTLRKNASQKTKEAYEAALAAGQTTIDVVDADAVITRKHLQGWHSGLTKHLVQDLGYDPAVYTGITKALGGNMTVPQIKRKGPEWCEARAKKVDAFHSSRRAAARGDKASLADRIALSGSKPQADPAAMPAQTRSSLDTMIRGANERKTNR